METSVLTATREGPGEERDLPLVERLGEEELAGFYREVAPRLWAYLLAHGRDRGLADDLCQEAFTRVLASRLEPRSREHLTRYLYKTAIHLLHDRHRRSRREPPLAGDAELRTAEAPADPGLRADLGRALAALDPRQRRLLWLAHVEGFDHATIAATLGARPGSIRVMLHRARRKLARLLGRNLEKETKR